MTSFTPSGVSSVITASNSPVKASNFVSCANRVQRSAIQCLTKKGPDPERDRAQHLPRDVSYPSMIHPCASARNRACTSCTSRRAKITASLARRKPRAASACRRRSSARASRASGLGAAVAGIEAPVSGNHERRVERLVVFGLSKDRSAEPADVLSVPEPPTARHGDRPFEVVDHVEDRPGLQDIPNPREVYRWPNA